MVWPKNLWIYQHGDFEAEPLYAFGDVYAVMALLLVGCVDEQLEPSGTTATLELELRDTAAISILFASKGNAATYIVVPSATHGVLPNRMEGAGSVESLPEADATLYVARFSAEAVADGPCGDEPLSIALSLHRPGASDTVSGGAERLLR